MRALLVVMLCALLCSCAARDPRVEPADHAGPQLGALHRQADDAYRAGRVDEARAAYSQLASALPGEALYWARLGDLEYLSADHERAAYSYQRALAVKPDYPEVLRNLASIHLQKASIYLERAASAASVSAGERPSYLGYLRAVEAARESGRAP